MIFTMASQPGTLSCEAAQVAWGVAVGRQLAVGGDAAAPLGQRLGSAWALTLLQMRYHKPDALQAHCSVGCAGVVRLQTTAGE